MTFLYPSFLWSLVVLSIPVIIHLFNFRKTTRVFFSNTRFLKQVKEVTTAKRRLKHYLILASRLLFLLFLVLAFAQPVIPARQQLEDTRNIVLYIDNSQSMTAQHEDRRRGLDVALGFAQRIVDLFPPDTRYRIVTNDFAPFSNTFKARTEATDILAQIRTSPVTRDMAEIKQRLEGDGTHRSREFFWISDFQKATAGTIPSRWDSASQWHLVPIQLSPTPNVFLDSAYLDNPFSATGEKNALTIRLRNDGQAEVDQLNVRLTINNIQAGTATLSIPGGGVAETTFDLTVGLQGLNRAVVSFNDFPVTFDNEFFIALNFTRKVNIIEIKPDSEVTPVERVFGNRSIFNFTSFAVTNFNYSLLSSADLVVINGLDRLGPSLSLSLSEYLHGGGTLMLVPGTRPDLAGFEQVIGANTLRVKTTDAASQILDRPDFDNPFFENVFEERSVSISMPQATPTWEWGTDRSAILQFRNDQPFLSRFNRQGWVYLMASPLRQGYTDLHTHALFVPVMYRIAASSLKNENKLYHTLNEDFIVLRLDSLPADESLRLVGDQEILPAQRRVNEQVFLEIPKFSMTQGFYNVMAATDTVGLVAFNLDNRESLLGRFTGEEVKNQMGNGENISIFEAESAEAFSSEIKERYLGKPLWKYAIFIALFFLLVEVLLIRFVK